MQYADAIEAAFTDTQQLFQDIPQEYLNLFEYYFFMAKEKILRDTGLFYKYLQQKAVAKNKHQVNDGKLSFSHPESFNDPFDCNYVLANNLDMSGKLRVLCLTKRFDNILMWSYYSDSHRGYCFGFTNYSILEKIESLELTGLCVYGSVDYKTKRPDIKNEVEAFSFTDLKYYVDAVFIKYSEWKHEDESRFVIISNKVDGDYISIQTDISIVYKGCSGKESPVLDSNGKILNTIKLAKDDTVYSLYAN